MKNVKKNVSDCERGILPAIIFLLLSVIATPLFAENPLAAGSLWSELESAPESIQKDTGLSKKSAESTGGDFRNARLFKLDVEQMRVLLGALGNNIGNNVAENIGDSSHHAARAATSPVSLTLPLPDGRQIPVKARETEVLPKPLAEKYPEIKTYRLLADKRIFSGRIELSPQGFHGMAQLQSGENVLIDPVNSRTDVYASYHKKDQNQNDAHPHQCLLTGEDNKKSQFSSVSAVSDKIVLAGKSQRDSSRSAEQLLQYRIAIAATGEYTRIKGGKSAALSAIVSTLNRVNQVYEQDLGIHLTLVDNNDAIIFVDPDSDPYQGDSYDMIVQNQTTIDRIIGNGNYDIGHLFATKGGGLATIGSVCQGGSKARGVSGASNPGNDAFSLDFVAHEIAHQLGATHTFNSQQGLCSGRTRTDQTAYEPGSGSTIMSYAGICGSDNLQAHADSMFHIGSIEQIRQFTQNGGGSRCGIRSQIANDSPRPDAGRDYTIPANTPFELKGQASDPDGDRLIYAWEQMDAGSASSAYEDKGNNALFRVRLPTASKNRVFPALDNLLYQRTSKGEILPVRERIMRFRFVAQDGHNAAQSDEMQVHIKRTGSRFALNLPRSHYTLGRDYRISWNVANTDRAPIYCDNVDISISTNGGYDYELLEQGVANTGEAQVYLPTTLDQTDRARFKLSCSNNIFFAISYRNFTLTLNDWEDAPEPGPEPDLNDRSSSASGASQGGVSSSQSQSTVSAGGGSFNLSWLILLSILGIMKGIMKGIMRLSKTRLISGANSAKC